MNRFFRKLFAKKNRPQPTSRTQKFRPRMEALEERALMTVGPEFHVNTEVILDQDAPEVASQQVVNGGSVVVWQDTFSAVTRDTDIKAQRYDGAGNKVGREIIVANSSRIEAQPAVAVDAQGNFVVTWTEVNGTNNDIKAQRFFANGARRGTAITVHGGAGQQLDSSVAMDQAGNFVVSYTDLVPVPNGRVDVMARSYASNGGLLKAFVVGGTGGSEFGSSVARSPDGRFSIAYSLGGTNIVLKRYDAASGLIGNHLLKSDVSAHSPDVAMDQFGHTVVVWARSSGGDQDVLAQKVYSFGTVDTLMSVASTLDQEFSPTVAMDLNDADFVVSYKRATKTSTNLMVREMTGSGGIKNTFDLGAVGGVGPAIAINGSDQYFLAYSANRSGDPGLGIYGRRGLLQ